MIDLSLPLYSVNIPDKNKYFSKLLPPDVRQGLPAGSKFLLNTAHAFGYSCFIPRMGEWSLPWNVAVAPGFEMPEYNPNYSKSFAEVSDMRAMDLKNLINTTGKKFAVFWSGGIDSTCCLTSIIKNLTEEELKHVHVAMSPDSIIENPRFYNNFIRNKIQVVDSQENRYSDFVEQGCTLSLKRLQINYQPILRS